MNVPREVHARVLPDPRRDVGLVSEPLAAERVVRQDDDELAGLNRLNGPRESLVADTKLAFVLIIRGQERRGQAEDADTEGAASIDSMRPTEEVIRRIRRR